MKISSPFTSSPAFFEAKYRAKADPWNFVGDAYEQRRYRAIVGALAHRRYGRAFEPGCSIGVLTEHLATLCDRVEAIDFSSTAAAQAAERCAHLAHVRVRCMALGEDSPVLGQQIGDETDPFDLLVLSEIGYYFEPEVWERLSAALVEGMTPGGTVLAAHWLGQSADHCMGGDRVHEILLTHPMLTLEHTERTPELRLDRLVRR